MATQKYLIVGATGKQGGAVVDCLLRSTLQSIHIYALTRDANSSRSKYLAANPKISIVVGDAAIPEPVFAQIGTPLDGVFCMTNPGGKITEEDQARAMIDACVKHRVKHFVFTSGDRGGPDVSDNNPTPVPNLRSKHIIEGYLKEQAEGRMIFTILRPVTFMEMLTPDLHGQGFGRLWAGLGNKPLQVISTKDIGYFGAVALLQPEKYNGKAISLAGDELTFDEASNIFKETTGVSMPLAPCVVGKGLKYFVGDLGHMFDWLETDGFKADIPSLRKEYPELQTFQEWLKQNSGWKQQ